MLFETAFGAVLNMLICGVVLWGALSSRLAEKGVAWAVVLWPAAFNVAVCLLKSDMTLAQRLVGISITAGVVSLYRWSWRFGWR